MLSQYFHTSFTRPPRVSEWWQGVGGGGGAFAIPKASPHYMMYYFLQGKPLISPQCVSKSTHLSIDEDTAIKNLLIEYPSPRSSPALGAFSRLSQIKRVTRDRDQYQETSLSTNSGLTVQQRTIRGFIRNSRGTNLLPLSSTPIRVLTLLM